MTTLNQSFKRNVPLLALCQALFMSGTSLVVTTSALVGFELAENKNYASLAFALQLVATMLTSIPAAMLMAKYGRKAAFLGAVIIAFAGAAICSAAIIMHQFSLFIVGSILIGIFSGFANFYRFTAADNVDDSQKSKAISYVLAGGVLAAFIGPNLANYTRDVIQGAAFAGSYASMLALYILSFVLLWRLDLPKPVAPIAGLKIATGRSLISIAGQPRFIVAVTCGTLGFAVMSLVMTATPLAMHAHAHPFSETSFVIQWHVLGMFAPSFFTGSLITRLGVLPVLLAGAVATLLCVIINLAGTSVTHFWGSLFLLGIGWNFLFIGATTLLTETYQPEERFKAQALNDFIIFSIVAAASLSAGMLQHSYGWRLVNYAALPAIIIILTSLGWLYILNSQARARKAFNTV